MKPLAVIEPDRSRCGELREIFESAGFPTECFHRGIEAMASLRRRSFSLAILDLNITDTDPFAVCRDASRVVPVIGIAERCDVDTCVRALESGAADCIVQPLPGRELLARARNILQRASSDIGGGPDSLELSLGEMRVRNGIETHDLSRGEAELLRLLIHHSPRPLTTKEAARLLDAPRATVESRIKSLRRKLGPTRLVNREGFGYVVGE